MRIVLEWEVLLTSILLYLYFNWCRSGWVSSVSFSPIFP